MAEREERRRDDDRRDEDRRDDDRDERRRRRCWPQFGNLHERVEIIKKAPNDDAREFLRTLIIAVFFEGVDCGREEECECAERLARAICCCEHHHRRREEEWGEEDEDEGDRGRSGRRRR